MAVILFDCNSPVQHPTVQILLGWNKTKVDLAPP